MKNKTSIIIIVVVLLVLIGGAIYFWVAKDKVAESEYQAVFLSNGQVYFGQVAWKKCRYVKLTDIYYLQLRQPQTLQSQKEGEAAAAAPATNLTLIKLGNELHGPLDVMKINRDHILFIEGLKSDSKVVQAIMEYKNQQQEQEQE